MIKNIPVKGQQGVTQTVCSHREFKDICFDCLMTTIHGYGKKQFENRRDLT